MLKTAKIPNGFKKEYDEVLPRIKEGKANPKLIVAVPVGFVGASESKEDLDELGIPYIRVKGRKGGSTVAAAIVNALMYNVYER